LSDCPKQVNLRDQKEGNMIWLVSAIVAVVCGGAGFWLGMKLIKSAMDDRQIALIHEQTVDRQQYLACVRREIANVLVTRNADAYLAVLKQVEARVDELRNKTDALAAHEHQHLAKKYPQYSDFDPFQTLDHVLFSNTVDWMSDEELGAHYSDIIYFEALCARVLKSWKRFDPLPQRQRDHAIDYAQKLKDSLFLDRLKEAETIYYLTCGDEMNIENAKFSVRWVNHFAEVRHGVMFKDTGEYGLFSSFHDDKNGQIYKSYMRSDASFNEGKHLMGL
jgi:hypothetical protein